MDPAYAARYRELYERHWWWRAREELVLELLRDRAPAPGYGPILDVGCGDGLLLPKLRSLGEPEGIEPDGAILSEDATAAGRIHVVPFDASFQPGWRYGLILLLDVLEHLDDDVAALRHARALLAPNGLVVVTVPAFRGLWTAHDDINRHRVRYTAVTLRRVAGAAGLRVESERYLFQWVALAKLVVRLKERLLGPAKSLPGVPAAPVNRALLALCRAERWWWRRRSASFGSSLVVVLRAA
jgi:SAM-dependent methyltransferase